MHGWSGGRVLLLTWRARRTARPAKIHLYRQPDPVPHGMAIWGDLPPVTAVVGRIGYMVDRRLLRSGIAVNLAGETMTLRRPRYGLLPASRSIDVSTSSTHWTFQATPPFSTALFRSNGAVVARFYPWRTLLSDDATPEELTATLTIIAQHLSLRVVSPLAFTATLNLPRLGGSHEVV